MDPKQPISEPDLVKALSHPLRYRILTVLEQRNASPSDLAEEFGMPIGNVSYHVRQLAQLGLIRLVSRRQRRGAIEHYYRAQVRLDLRDDSWGEVPDTVRNAWVQTSLSAVAADVRAAAGAGGFAGEEAQLTRVALQLDEEGRREAARILRDAAEQLEALAERADQGDAEPSGAGPVTSAVLMLFEREGPAPV